MPSIGPMEIVAVAAIALIVFGPEKLPEIARTVGRTLSQLRRMADDVRDEFKDGLDFNADDDEDDDAPPSPRGDHPNVRAAGEASASKPAWKQASGEDAPPEEDFDPNYDMESGSKAVGDQDDAPGDAEVDDRVRDEAPSEPQTGSGTEPPASAQTEVDRPPGQQAG